MIDPRNLQETREIDEGSVLETSALPEYEEEQASDSEAATEMQDGAAVDKTATPPSTEPPSKKRVKKVQPTEEELMPHPSMWPFVLALSVAVMLGGFAFQPVLLAIGVIMVIVSVIGWNLERR